MLKLTFQNVHFVFGGMPMESQISISQNTLTADLFRELFSAVGWEPPCREQVAQALSHTLATFTAILEGTPVGMVRLLGDGAMSFYLKDFAVLPALQGRGVGRALLQATQEFLLSSLPQGWAVSLELISTPQAVGFYRRQGFEERPCAWDGPGMFKMLRRDRAAE